MGYSCIAYTLGIFLDSFLLFENPDKSKTDNQHDADENEKEI